MGDLVCDGTEFSCPFCTSKLKLKVLSSKVTGEGKKIANIGNCLFPPPGGNCTVVPSAPVPCTPAVTSIDQGQKNVTVDQVPALGEGCKFQCVKGGLLTVSSSGQSQGKHDEATGAPLVSMAASMTPFFPPPLKKEKEDEQEGEEPIHNDDCELIQKDIDRCQKRINKKKKHLTSKDLNAAWRENTKGEVVARKDCGTPFDHVHEVRDAQRGLKNDIRTLKRILKEPKISPSQTAKTEKLLSEASQILDHSEGFVSSTPLFRL